MLPILYLFPAAFPSCVLAFASLPELSVYEPKLCSPSVLVASRLLEAAIWQLSSLGRCCKLAPASQQQL